MVFLAPGEDVHIKCVYLYNCMVPVCLLGLDFCEERLRTYNACVDAKHCAFAFPKCVIWA